MKIDPQLPPLPQPPGTQPQAAGSPFESFEDMLGGEATAAQPAPAHRALAFVELGMFGRGEAAVPGASSVDHEEQVAAAGPAGAASPAAPPVSPEAQIAAVASGKSTSAEPPLQEVTAAAQQALAGLPVLHQEAGTSPRQAPGTSGPRAIVVATERPTVAAPAPYIPAEANEAEPSDAAGASAPDAPERHEEKSDSPLRLVFNERDGSASIVAAAGNLTPEQRASLRRRTAELLLEHGILLSKFTLNGAALSGLTYYRNGDTHGPRTR
jgi:hypothetical protein